MSADGPPPCVPAACRRAHARLLTLGARRRASAGFDGFASTIALASLAYCVPLGLAIVLGLRGPNRRFVPAAAAAPATSVEPLTI